MKIKSLITKLQKLDPNLEVFLASDAEGNFYSNLSEISACQENEFYDKTEREFTTKDYIEKFSKSRYVKGIVLYPV